MEVEELLAKDGIDATVVNLRFAKPLDYEMLDEVLDYHSLIVTNGGKCAFRRCR